MSIWCSGETIGYEDESLLTGVIEGGEVREPQSHWAGNGVVLSYAHGWSNHYPDGTAEHPASIDLATIPPWCVPDHRDEDDWSTVGPWLRLSVDSPLAVTMWEKDADGNPAPHPEYHAAGWKIKDPPKYYRVTCPCGTHYRWIHLTPSGSAYVKDALKWLYRQPCYNGSQS